jgi:DNA-binding MarR family transcriptional regulator
VSLTETLRVLRGAISAPLDPERVDRLLRDAVVCWIREPTADHEAIDTLLVSARDLATAEDCAWWWARWALLMDLLRDADRTASLHKELRAVAEAKGLGVLLHLRGAPARSEEIGQALGKSASDTADVIARLEAAGLVVTMPGGGRSRPIVLTPRGYQLLAVLPAVT